VPIELICKGCSRKLRVGDEHAGKHARCPECGEINPITKAGQDAESRGSLGPAFGSDSGTVREPHKPFPEMPTTSPPAPSFGTAPDRPQPEFTWAPPPASAAPNPFADRSVAPASGYPGIRPGLAPHRGAVILVFGILGFFVCFIFSVLAWIWGAEDLRKMRRGTMDPSGMALTQVGMILGIICCAMAALGFVMFLLLIVIGMA